MDLKDAIAKRPVLSKSAYRDRVRRVLRSVKFQRIARNCALGLRKVCKQVQLNKGSATKG